MLVELAIGDAFGAGYEYTGRVDRHELELAYVQHPTHRGTRPGMYTDDTQMSLAIAEALVEQKPWSKSSLSKFFTAIRGKVMPVPFTRS
jgi:ADP-ribosylglycohydrolase